jgi:CHASE3 domain sensor protein
MDRTKLILIAVAVSLAITLAVVFYRMGIINQRTSDIKTEIALHKANALELLNRLKTRISKTQGC